MNVAALHEAKRAKREQIIWDEVCVIRKRTSCTCYLRKGMDADGLRDLGAGCRGPHYVCAALDLMRRLIA